MAGFIERIDSRIWSPEFLDKAVGQFQRTAFCYATAPELRLNAASGGVATATLIHLLETKQVDGALIVASWIEDGQYHCGFRIVSSREQVISAQGSKYMPVYFNRDAAPLIREFMGRLAVVLLPCDALSLARLRASEPEVDRKIAFVMTLFCGHNSERELTDAIINRFCPSDAALTHFQHRFGHWRGNMRIRYNLDQETIRPFSEFSVYQNLFFFAQKKCHACFDHFGFHCDLSIGDIWSRKMKSDPIKKNAIVARSRQAVDIIAQLASLGALQVEDVKIDDVCNGQSRALPFHYNISARSRVGALFGMRLKDTTHSKVKWNDTATAFLVMFNERITRNRAGRALILRIPRPLLRAYLIFLKGLESF